MSFLKYLPGSIQKNLDLSGQPHRVILEAIKSQLDLADEDLDIFLRELVIFTATEGWLDEWGSWFGVLRVGVESDADYSTRILNKILISNTTTIPSIRESIAKFMNAQLGYDLYSTEDIEIIEPYKFLKSFSSKGTFSGVHRFPDNSYWRRGVIEVVLPDNPTPELVEFINKIKASGIKAVISVKSLLENITSYGLLETYFYNSIENSFKTNYTVEGHKFSASSMNNKLSGTQTIWCDVKVTP